MIYRQVIPPAPAYLGLNLFLKGTQVMAKNGAPKKEKPKIDSKPKSERKSSLLSVKTAESEKTPILSPRSLLIDFADCNETYSTASISSARKRICSLTKLNKDNLLKNEKVMANRLHSYIALTRYPSKHSDLKDPLSGRRPIGKVPDSSRRHASCGPKLSSTVPKDDGKAEDAEIGANDRTNIKCVGSKCGPEIENTGTTVESNKSSPQKASPEPSKIITMRTKLKPISSVSKSAKPIVPNVKDKPTASSNDYRKYLARNSLQLSRIPSKAPIHSNYYNSHFYAVGLSLRAWRSKYSRNKSNAPDTSLPSSSVANNNNNNSVVKGKNV